MPVSRPHVAAALALATAVAGALSILAPTRSAATVSVNQVYSVPSSGSFTVRGHGYGHGNGMSQHGAQGAALRGLGTGVMPPLWERLGELAMPVDLVVGQRDEKFRAIAERMAERIPAARVHVVAAAGHALAADPAVSVRLAVLPLLWEAREDFPRAGRLVEQAAGDDPAGEVRQLAASLAAPAR